MKKGILLTAFAVIVAVIVYSYPNGPAFQAGIDATGASGNTTGCGNGCHTGGTTDGTVVELDSAGVPVTTYHGGINYTIKVSASNGSNLTLSHFGFQITAVKMSGAGTSLATDAGTWGTSLPARVQKTTTDISHLPETIIEHDSAITATSGTGANGSTYVELIPWTAPASGTGTVVIYGVVNEVNFDGTNSGDLYQVASRVIIHEATGAPVRAGVSIQQTGGPTNGCSGSTVTFSAAPTNGGTVPTYQWMLNGSAISGATSSTYSAGTVGAGYDTITCVMTSNLPGVTGNPATSNLIIDTVSRNVNASIRITVSDSTVCSGQTVTFTSTSTNPGLSPTWQWYNGSTAISGAASSTYSSSTLINGSVIKAELTSDANCVLVPTVQSNAITITVSGNLTPGVSIVSSAGNSLCTGQSTDFTATAVNGGTLPAYQWYKNGTAIAGAASSTYTTSTLINNDAVTCVITSNSPCASPATAVSNAITFTVGNNVAPTITITSSLGSSFCSGQTTTFTSAITNGGSTPAYQWYDNGSVITGAAASTYATSTLANNDAVKCILTSSSTCASPTTAASNTITVTVGSVAATSVSIVSSLGNSFCSGQTTTFTATPANGGSAPVYQWYKNGAAISGATASAYSTAALANNDVILCGLTSNLPCASPTTVISNSITVAITAGGAAGVSITSSAGSSLCSGQSTTFTATATNGGTLPTYQWYKNGSAIVGATSSTYTTSSLVNNDEITCGLTSNAPCVSPSAATSNSITITITTNGVPSLTITSNPGDTICSGQNIVFRSNAVNGGAAPTYQWYNGSTPITNATQSVYFTNSITNNAVISCKMVSNSTCVTTTNATSNSLTIDVQSSVTPSVSIISSLGTGFCTGQTTTFTATPVNGGPSPAYQWYNDGSVISGATASTYSSPSLTNGTSIFAVLTSNAACASSASANSDTITLNIGSSLNAGVTVSSNTSDSICAGSQVTLTATAVNGGSAPTYQWLLNSSNITGATSSTYAPASVSNGDAYTVKMVSNSSCVTQATVVSPAYTFAVFTAGAAGVTVAANGGLSICPGTPLTFTAVITNGGAHPTYQWAKNGTNVGTNAGTYVDTALANGDVISCSVSSSLDCASPATAVSNSLAITVYTAPVSSITESGNTLTASAGSSYVWFLNNVLQNDTNQTLIPAANGSYTVKVTDAHGCSALSSAFNVTGVGIFEPSALAGVSVYPNPADNNLFVDFKGVSVDGKVTIRLFDVNGRVLLEDISSPVTGENVSLDMSQVQDGIYLLQINENDANAYRKIIVSR